MKLFTVIYLWIINLFTPAVAPAVERRMPHKLDLQFFADGDDDEGGDEDDGGDDDDSDDDEDEDDTPDLNELLKNPKFKKQYNERFKTQLGKRMKKFEGINPDEARRLKQQAEKGKGKGADDDDDEGDDSQNKEQEQRLLRAERREKRALVKEEALERGYNPKLVARLIDLNEVDLDEDGESDNLEELIDDLEAEFGHLLGGSRDDDEDDDEDEASVKKKSYKPGRNQKNNKKTKKKDPRALGAERAAARHKKKED